MVEDDELSLDYVPPQNLLTIEDVSKRLNVSMAYVQKLARDGDLPVINLGHKTKRIDPISVDELILKKTMAQLPVRKRIAAGTRRVLQGKQPSRNGAVERITSLEQAEQALQPQGAPDDLEL